MYEELLIRKDSPFSSRLAFKFMQIHLGENDIKNNISREMFRKYSKQMLRNNVQYIDEIS